jgi:hypothetical protein
MQTIKRVGFVLVVAGLLDIMVMIYCLAKGLRYSSSINVFAVIAGILLIRGGLRTASIVSWFAVLLLSCVTGGVVALPFLQPLDLTFTQIRLEPMMFVASVIYFALLAALLSWVTHELRRPSICSEISRSGAKVHSTWPPALCGICLVFIAIAAIKISEGHGVSARRAEALAAAQLGAGYRYHVTSLTIARREHRTFVSGVVTAWNRSGVREVPFKWKDQ